MICDKIAYKTKHEVKLHRLGLNIKDCGKTSVYICPECGFFHLATIKPSNKKKKNRFKKRVNKYPIKADELPIVHAVKKYLHGKNMHPKERVVIETTYRPFENLRLLLLTQK